MNKVKIVRKLLLFENSLKLIIRLLSSISHNHIHCVITSQVLTTKFSRWEYKKIFPES